MYSLVERDTIKSIQQNIKLILTTPKGSDIHRPNFGSNLYQIIDKPMTAITIGRIRAEITDAIEYWEPRVSVKNIVLNKDYINAKLKITITLKVKETEEVIEEVLWI